MRKKMFSVTLVAFPSCFCGGEKDGRAQFIGVIVEMCFRTNTSAFPLLARSADKRAEAEFNHNVHISYVALKAVSSISIQDGSKQVKISRLSVTTGTTRQKNTLNMVRERKQHLSHFLMVFCFFLCLKVALYLHSLIFIQ